VGYFVLLQPWWRARSRIILRLSASGNYDAGILGVARTRAALYSRASGIALVAREFGQPAPHGPRLPDRVGVALRAGNNPQPRPRRLAALQRVAAIIALRGGIRGPVYFGLRVTGTYFVFTRLSVLLVFVVGLYWTYILFANLKEDTTTITNAAFAVVATLAALAFSCARAVRDSDEAADRFEYAGERFFHGAILLIFASVLKYAYISAVAARPLDDGGMLRKALTTSTGLLVGVLFFWALSSVHGGMIVLTGSCGRVSVGTPTGTT